jgi:hypothetical protein
MVVNFRAQIQFEPGTLIDAAEAGAAALPLATFLILTIPARALRLY